MALRLLVYLYLVRVLKENRLFNTIKITDPDLLEYAFAPCKLLIQTKQLLEGLTAPQAIEALKVLNY